MSSLLPTQYQEFIYTRTYSRYLDEHKRRETWQETVDRYFSFFINKLSKHELPTEAYDELATAKDDMLQLKAMGSMRALWTAGEALERENIAGYNCSYAVIDRPKAFAEILYILMNGTGVGFSTERQHITKLPFVPPFMNHFKDDVIVFEDSKLGWAEGFYKYVMALYEGRIPDYDLSKIRKKGSRLKTFGGRASGPEPLQDLLEFTTNIFSNAIGRKLNSIECYDIVCKTAEIVIVGGVRRSATINLSNPSDDRMRHAKDGQFWLNNAQRSLSNNSAVYTEKPSATAFMEEWLALAKSGNGERGIVNREGLQKKAESIGRKPEEFGVNPCGEIALRSNSFCNLSEIVVRPEDTIEDLKAKARSATILGVLQSTLTDFQFLDERWKENCEEERLLGVSLTGTCDHVVLGDNCLTGDLELPCPESCPSKGTDLSCYAVDWLKEIKSEVIQTAHKWSKMLGINMPTALTCVKPSGTVSQLVDSSSGLHPRYAEHYIRRVRVSTTDPLCNLLIDSGYSYNPEVGQTLEDANTYVFEFYHKSPNKDAVYRNDRDAIEQLDYWLLFKEYWCDHNPSVTIYVKDSEWLSVGAWVYEHWDEIGGLSFLPYDGGNYPLAPYEEISKEEYEACQNRNINFGLLGQYEQTDTTQGSREFACSGGTCEL